jgi:hypothetical protein
MTWVLVKVRYEEPGAADQGPALEIERTLAAEDLSSAPGE